MSTLKKLYILYKPFRWKIGILSIFLLAGSAVALITPYFFGQIVLSITEQGVTRAVWTPVFYAAIASVIVLIFYYIQIQYQVLNIDHDIPDYLRRTTVKKADELSVSQHMNENSSKLQSVVLIGESATINLVMGAFIYNLLPMSAQLFVTIGLILFIDWRIAIWMLLGIVGVVYMTFIFRSKFKDRLEELEEERHDRTTFMSEIFRNFIIIKLFGSSRKMVDRFITKTDQVLVHNKDVLSKLASTHTVRGIMFEIITFGAIVISLFGMMQGRYDIAIFVALFAWIQSSTGRLGNIYFVIRRITEDYPKVEKYLEYLDTRSDVKFGKAKINRIDGHVEFKNVVYTYRNKGYLTKDDKDKIKEKPTQALSGTSFVIKPGQTVALVGPSGAGKSTIVQMMLGAYLPEKGDVLVDGKSLKDYNIDSLRQFIGYVPQQIDPFDDTIRANIELGLPMGKKSTKDLMQKTIEMSALHEVVKRSPQGLETKIGEKGIKLSGGERQRLGIARALIRDPRILIFDEATSSLDTKNERLITEAVQKIAKDRTTIIIAHRLATVAHADKIIFVKEGKVAAEGTHQELLASSPDYRELVEHQLVLG